MAITAVPNPLSQCDRAIVAYLTGASVGMTNVLPAHTPNSSTYPNTKVKTFSATQDPDLTGNERVQIQIQFKQSAATGKGDSNPEAKRVALDNLVGLGMAAMLQSDDEETLRFTAAAITAAGRALATSSPTNNADMADFTLTNLHYKGAQRGEPDDQGAAWIEIRNFEATVCPTAIA